MRIAYIDPLSRAWGRMTKALFKPFDIKKWFVVGFTAFLATLLEGPRGNVSSGGRGGSGDHGESNFGEVIHFPRTAWEWLVAHPGWFSLIIFGVLLLMAWIILMTWLSSRGKFMFVDNVVHDRALVVKPWKEFKKRGNSLFLWRLCFGFVCLALFILFVMLGFVLAAHIYWRDIPLPTSIMLVAGAVLLAIFVIVVTAYISLFLTDFIVPIMHKNNIKTNKAWGHFLPLFAKHWPHFILYGLFIFALSILAVICVIITGLLTCCIGFLLMIIPYIGSVVLLPISYTFRAFSLEYLGQFGPEFTLFSQLENSSAASP